MEKKVIGSYLEIELKILTGYAKKHGATQDELKTLVGTYQIARKYLPFYKRWRLKVLRWRHSSLEEELSWVIHYAKRKGATAKELETMFNTFPIIQKYLPKYQKKES